MVGLSQEMGVYVLGREGHREGPPSRPNTSLYEPMTGEERTDRVAPKIPGTLADFVWSGWIAMEGGCRLPRSRESELFLERDRWGPLDD